MLSDYRGRQRSPGVSVPPNVARLNISDVIGSALRDAIPLMRSRPNLWLRFAAVAAAAGLLLPSWPEPPPMRMTTLHALLYRPSIDFWFSTLGFSAQFFVVGSAVRTVRRSWRWNLVNGCGFFGILLLLGLLELPAFLLWDGRRTLLVAELLLFLPGLFLAIRCSQAPWCLLLSNGVHSFVESWRITSGAFWKNLLFSVFPSILTDLPVLALGVKLALAYPIAGVVILPLTLLVEVLLLHVWALCGVRWMLALRARSAVTSQQLPAGVTAL